MNVPDRITAEQLLSEAEQLNPGPWIQHCQVAGMCAKAIASRCPDLDENAAYSMGLLHDIGRRDGVMDMRHVVCGYRFLLSLGYDGCARVCLTHSFPDQNLDSYAGVNDCASDETALLEAFIRGAAYDDYDRLIQLCDAISLPDGPTFVEKRLVDVALRKGFNEWTVPKWKAFLETKQYFDRKLGMDLYKLFRI